VRVEFVGGARDGAVIDIPEPLPHRWVIPCVMQALSEWVTEAPDHTRRLKVMVYELQHVGFHETRDPNVSRAVYRLVGTGVV
jgi:hypothetical protein